MPERNASQQRPACSVLNSLSLSLSRSLSTNFTSYRMYIYICITQTTHTPLHTSPCCILSSFTLHVAVQDRSSTTIRLLLKAGSSTSCHWGWVKTIQNLLIIPFGYAHQFTSYFGVHQKRLKKSTKVWPTAICWWKSMSERFLESPKWNSTGHDLLQPIQNYANQQ